MATIEERKQQLEKKLKKMAEDNVVVKPVNGSQPLRSIRGHRAFPRNITRGRQKFGRNEDGKRRTKQTKQEERKSGTRNRKEKGSQEWKSPAGRPFP